MASPPSGGEDFFVYYIAYFGYYLLSLYCIYLRMGKMTLNTLYISAAAVMSCGSVCYNVELPPPYLFRNQLVVYSGESACGQMFCRALSSTAFCVCI